MAEQIVRDLLLDTHTVIWASHEDDMKYLGENARAALEKSDCKLYVSAVTAYEITNKYRNGKLDQYKDIAEQYSDVINVLNAEELPVTAHQAYDAGMLEWDHKDPFDRMIAAQARSEGLALVTCDKAFGAAPGVEVLW
ncbi:MAG: type II toxin-antitoxin system VapC family toxin [Clostridiales Family XIII bacterium]|jgi:PIN domain nuclease of toxin-antitoxin system|nr:type II toxin-antitoxin system VapC family toxin [Clostridiales Family XIII bacterium]